MIGQSQPTTIVLQLVDMLLAKLEHIVEDILVYLVSLIFVLGFLVHNF